MKKNLVNRKLRLVDYFDVWGNEDDGWEVNNQCVIMDDIVLDEEAVNDDIVSFLIMCGYLKQGTDVEDLIIDWEDSFIELYQKEDGRPLCCLMKY